MLSENAKTALDEMATPLKNQRGYVVEVQGFASGHGQVAISNSQKMAESVVRYLALNHDIPIYRIYLVGMGNAPAPSRGRRSQAQAHHRRPRRSQPPEEQSGAACLDQHGSPDAEQNQQK